MLTNSRKTFDNIRDFRDESCRVNGLIEMRKLTTIDSFKELGKHNSYFNPMLLLTRYLSEIEGNSVFQEIKDEIVVLCDTII